MCLQIIFINIQVVVKKILLSWNPFSLVCIPNIRTQSKQENNVSSYLVRASNINTKTNVTQW